MDNLQIQIDHAARTIATDSYSMSIGEIINMYKDKEIDVHPEFQRAFRWEIEQKSALIESILLGIPMPPIFIFHREDGVWDVIDGQQRLCTIFQFIGEYLDHEGEKQPPIKLTKTKFLPALDGILWESADDNVYQLTTAQRILIKRAKIDVKLLKSTSDKNAKYDLFQRLNSGGSHLTPQEVRTCIIIMESPAFYDHLVEMSNNHDFINTLPLTERAIQEQENLEFIIRFIVARNCSIDNMPSSLHEFFDDSIVSLINSAEFDIGNEKSIFNRTFKLLDDHFGADSFRRYNAEKDTFEGATTISAFEALAPAISKDINLYENMGTNDIRKKIVAMHSHPDYARAAARRSTDRYKALLKVGKDIFNEHKDPIS